MTSRTGHVPIRKEQRNKIQKQELIAYSPVYMGLLYEQGPTVRLQNLAHRFLLRISHGTIPTNLFYSHPNLLAAFFLLECFLQQVGTGKGCLQLSPARTQLLYQWVTLYHAHPANTFLSQLWQPHLLQLCFVVGVVAKIRCRAKSSVVLSSQLTALNGRERKRGSHLPTASILRPPGDHSPG